LAGFGNSKDKKHGSGKYKCIGVLMRKQGKQVANSCPAVGSAPQYGIPLDIHIYQIKTFTIIQEVKVVTNYEK